MAPAVRPSRRYPGGVTYCEKCARERMHHLRGDTVKTPVVPIVQRKGKVVAKVVPDATQDSIYPLIRTSCREA